MTSCDVASKAAHMCFSNKLRFVARSGISACVVVCGGACI